MYAIRSYYELPALLISTAMGMVVTRSASESSLNADLKKQFMSQPIVLIIAGSVEISMILIPGFPKIQLLFFGGTLITIGILLLRANNRNELAIEQAEMAEVEEAVSEMDYYKDIDNVYKLLAVEPIEIEFGYSLIPLADEKSGGTFIERVVVFRKQFALEMGMVFPSIRMRDNQNINPNQYIIKVKGEEIARAEILVDHFLALDSGNVENPIDGIDTRITSYNVCYTKLLRNNKKK